MAAAREKYQQERDRNIVAEYYIKGYSTRAIAEIITRQIPNYSITHSTVSSDVKYLLKQWRESRVSDIDDMTALELTKLDKLEHTYWEAWEKSITDHTRTSNKLKGKKPKAGEKGVADYKEVTETDMIAFGNPAYLAGIERCIERRCKILGIDAPTKHDHTSGGKSFLDLLAESSHDGDAGG